MAEGRKAAAGTRDGVVNVLLQCGEAQADADYSRPVPRRRSVGQLPKEPRMTRPGYAA